MILLIYVSSATVEFSEQGLIDLLTKARANNLNQDITGMLVYSSGNFMQALEGDEDGVQALFERIKQDRRHTGVIKLYERKTGAREFGEWSMAFRNLTTVPTSELKGYSTFLNKPFSQQFKDKPTLAHEILLSFRDTMR